MSEHLRHKMIDFAVAPPPTAWDNIAARLYDDNKYASVSAKMNDFEAILPPNAWENIATRLDDDKQYAAVASKMNDFKTALPSGVWENITARLDDDKQYAVVGAKMNDFTTTPPPQIWDNVLAALEETKPNQVPVINMRRSIFRVAAAAIVIGIFIGSWILINNKNNQKIVAKTTTTTPHTNPVQPIVADNNKEDGTARINVTSNKKENLAVAGISPHQHSIKNDYAVLPADDVNDNAPKYAKINNLAAHIIPVSTIMAAPILDKNGNPVMDMDVLTTNSNYFLITGPNGQLTRISSKFANVIRFLDDKNSSDTEEYVDRVIKESSVWKKRFQEWRNKISQSTYIPSSVNFLDIVELKDLIQGKQ
ncbi:MAG: hypothetical protein ABJB86_01530 [Bacteroidota bacterium]